MRGGEWAIWARGLTRRFRRPVSRPGLGGALLDLFSRRYEVVTAVDGIDLAVEPGEIVGYIGPNGAGKSTTIKLLTGILVPTAGHVSVNGFVPWRERRLFVRTIGAVFGQRTQLWWDIAAQESFRLLARIYQLGEEEYRSQLRLLADVLDLGPLLAVPVRKLSLGQRMRCELAAALLHRPSLVFLDEPTIGLDVVAKLAVREFLREINRRQGTTIFLTTHDLGDIQAVCHRAVVLNRGRIVYDGSLTGLRRAARSGLGEAASLEEAVRALYQAGAGGARG